MNFTQTVAIKGIVPKHDANGLTMLNDMRPGNDE